MSEHSIVAPSSADKWAYCAGFAQMAPFFPEEDTDESREGQAAHWLAAEMLESYRRQGSPIIDFKQVQGRADPNGTVVTEVMFEGAKLYVDDVLAEVSSAENMDGLYVEHRVHAQRIHERVFGTCDAWFYDPSMKLLIIWDFKFGHLDIPAFENPQLICYYAGISDFLQMNGLDDQVTRVSLRAVQPRCFTPNGPFKEWNVLANDLRGYINQLSEAAHKALERDALCKSGSHCRYCPARHGCGAARKAALAGVDYAHKAIPEVLTDEAVSYELATLEDAASAIKYRLEAMQEEAKGRIREGKTIAGFGIEHGFGTRQWISGTYLDALEGMCGVSLMKDPEPVTVVEAERRMKGKGLKPKQIETVLNGMYERPNKGLKLVRSKTTDARRIFSQE